MVNRIQTLMGCKSLEPDIWNYTEGEIWSQCLLAFKPHNILEWKPAFDLESGPRETVTWYRNFLGAGA